MRTNATPASAVLTSVALVVTASAPASADPTAAPTVLYVHAAATGTTDGSSWHDAYTDLQDALDHAATIPPPEPVEIWVAAGVYKPDRGTGDQTLAFELPGDLALFGGFSGWETDRNQRNILVALPVLSGDLLSNDDPTFVPESTCCAETFQPGCDDQGCLQAVLSEWPQCALSWNFNCAKLAWDLCCDLCNPYRCDNSFNVLRVNGADAAPLIDGFIVCGGVARGVLLPFRYGGGLYSLDASPTVQNCRFEDNTATYGSAIFSHGGTPIIRDSTFVANHPSLGNAFEVVYNRLSDPLIERCVFISNRGGAISFDDTSRAPIRDCHFEDNTGRAVHMEGAKRMERCVFVGNSGGALRTEGRHTLVNCDFRGNIASGEGGAIANFGIVTLRNCLFVGNRAGLGEISGLGGAFVNATGFADFYNCTVVKNAAGTASGIWSSGTARLTNCVLWGNGSPFVHAQIATHSTNPPIVNYNIIQGWSGNLIGVANSGADPQFRDPLGPDGIAGTGDDDYRLAPDSPAIDAGDPAYNPVSGPADLDGVPRILCGRVDIGAYESGLGDFNCDRTADLTDFAAFPFCMTGPALPPSQGGIQGGLPTRDTHGAVRRVVDDALSDPTLAPALLYRDSHGAAPLQHRDSHEAVSTLDPRTSARAALDGGPIDRLENRSHTGDESPRLDGCEAFDANADERIDLADFARLQRFLTAP